MICRVTGSWTQEQSQAWFSSSRAGKGQTLILYWRLMTWDLPSTNLPHDTPLLRSHYVILAPETPCPFLQQGRGRATCCALRALFPLFLNNDCVNLNHRDPQSKKTVLAWHEDLHDMLTACNTLHGLTNNLQPLYCNITHTLCDIQILFIKYKMNQFQAYELM